MLKVVLFCCRSPSINHQLYIVFRFFFITLTKSGKSQGNQLLTILCLFRRFKSYFKDSWNTFDFITVVGSIVDALAVEFAVSNHSLTSMICYMIDLIIWSEPYIYAAEFHQRWISPFVPGRKVDQTPQARLHNSHSLVDLRSVLQGKNPLYYICFNVQKHHE